MVTLNRSKVCLNNAGGGFESLARVWIGRLSDLGYNQVTAIVLATYQRLKSVKL